MMSLQGKPHHESRYLQQPMQLFPYSTLLPYYSRVQQHTKLYNCHCWFFPCIYMTSSQLRDVSGLDCTPVMA